MQVLDAPQRIRPASMRPGLNVRDSARIERGFGSRRIASMRPGLNVRDSMAGIRAALGR